MYQMVKLGKNGRVTKSKLWEIWQQTLIAPPAGKHCSRRLCRIANLKCIYTAAWQFVFLSQLQLNNNN